MLTRRLETGAVFFFDAPPWRIRLRRPAGMRYAADVEELRRLDDAALRARFSRQTALAQIGEEGQRRLLGARALLVGVGALGCAAAEALVRAGVGALTLVDRDVVDETNLHRQGLFTEEDAKARLPKVEAAARRLGAISALVRVEPVAADVDPPFAKLLAQSAERFDVILDATDNFETRYLLNDLAVATSTPLAYAGVVGTQGVVTTILPAAPSGRDVPWGGRRTPCLRCLFPTPPPPGSTPTCQTAGVLPTAPPLIAMLQATEALKVLLGAFDAIEPRLLSVDVWTGQLRSLDTSSARDSACPCCGQRRFEHLERAGAGGAAALCGRGSVQIHPAKRGGVSLEALAESWRSVARVRRSELALQAELPSEQAEQGGPVRLTVFADGRAVVHGVSDEKRARAIYARWVSG